MAGESVAQGGRILARAFRGTYDFMGMTMVISSIWFLLGFVPAGLAFLVMIQMPSAMSAILFALVSITLLGPLTAATYSMNTAMIQGEYVQVRELFVRFKRHYKKVVGVTAVMMAILAVLVVDLLFFIRSDTAWLEFLSLFWVYFILFWALMAQYIYPLVVRQDPKVFETMKMAALLALDNVIATLVMTVAGLAVAAISLFLRIPLLLFFVGTLGFVHCVGLDEVIGKYGRSESGSRGIVEGEITDD